MKTFKPGEEATFIGYAVEIESINECGVAFVHHLDDKSIKFHVRTEYLEEIVRGCPVTFV